MTKKVLVLGGTGAMGVYLVPALLDIGYKVYVTSRQKHKSDDKNLIYIQGNGHDMEFLRKTLSSGKYDAIVDFMVYNTAEFRERYQLLLKNCDHYLFLSTYRVFSDSEVITERSPRLLDVLTDNNYLQTDEYALTKARQEDMLRNASRENWTIIRPAITYSRERFQLGTMELDVFVFRALQNLPVIFPSAMLQKTTTMTWAGDVARLISKLVLNKKAFGEDFNLATNEYQTWARVIEIYKEIISLDIKNVSLKKYIDAMGGGHAKYQVIYDRMFNRKLDNSKVLRVTGVKQAEFTKLKDGLKQELSYFMKNPKFESVDYVKQAKFDKLTQSRLDINLLNTEDKEIYRANNPSMFEALRRTLRLRTRVKEVLNKTRHTLRVRTRARQLSSVIGRYLDMYKYNRADGAILTLTGYFNYGNVIQRYALQEFLRQNNYNFVSYVDTYSAPRDMYRVGRKIKAKTPLRMTKRFLKNQKPYWYIPGYEETYPEAKRMKYLIDFVNNNIWIKPFDPRDKYKKYIVGSDQVWRNWHNNIESLGYFFFNFLQDRRVNRISYAASFGKDKIDEVMSQEDIENIKPLIEKFDNISVREKSGIKMIEKTWGIKDVKEVVDPTLLLNKDNYSMLIDRGRVEHTKIPPIFAYILDETPEIKKFIKNIQTSRQQKTMKIRAHGGAENDILPPMELWLKGFRDAEIVVTNSFHGMMLSMINNTNFIIIGRSDGGLSRIKDFLSKYGLEDRFVNEKQLDGYNFSDLENIDWSSVNKKLEKSRKDSAKWLIASLAYNYD